MNTNYKKIKTYIKSIKKYQIKSIELDENNNEFEIISINYKLLNEDINNINKDLISALIKDKLCKELFFDKIEDVYIFNQNKFLEVMFNTNEYMDGSYTKYSSNIGLFLKDEDKVQLNFPYKDCVLVGGMDKEDDKVNLEVFYNEILEKDKINKLFEPKVFTNIKKYSYVKKLAEDDKLDNPNNIQVDNNIDKIQFETIIDEDGNEQQKLKDNLLIKGNNLLGLHSLARRMSGMIEVIYIDPPYYFKDSKASDSFAYNSNFKLSTWLTFMKNRLEIARELLSDTGVIFISMNEDGNSHLKLLCDDIFGVNNYYGNIIWKKQADNRKKTTTMLIENENVLCYGFKTKLLKRKTIPKMSNVDNDKRGNWFNANISSPVENEASKGVYEIKINGIKYKRRWWIKKEELLLLINNNKIYVPKNGKGTPRRKMFLEDFLNEKNQFSNLLLEQGTSTSAKETLKNLNINTENFDTPKPIKLIKHLVDSCNKNATILDFFAGSGTTAHSVLSLNKEDGGNRKFILLEQMDYIENITAERIRRCMIKENYEDSFIYMEMKESNIKELKNSIKSAKDKDELISLIENNFDEGYFINIDNKEQLLLKIEEIYNKITQKTISKTNTIQKFNDQFLLESIKLVIEKHMDNNLDYVSYEDIDELKLSNKIKDNEYQLNKSFYEGFLI